MMVFGEHAYAGSRANLDRRKCLKSRSAMMTSARQICLSSATGPGSSVSTISSQSLLRFVRVLPLPDSDSKLIVKSFS